MIEAVLRGYAEVAEALSERYEAVAPETLYRPLLDLLPEPPARVLDLGAGRGRAWLDLGATKKPPLRDK